MKVLKAVILCLLAAGVFLYSKASTVERSRPKTTIKAIIEGEIDPNQHCDSIRLLIRRDDATFETVIPKIVYTKPLVNGKFRFEIDEEINHPIYFRIDSAKSAYVNSTSIKPFIEDFILENGDSIYIKIKDDNRTFSGKGAEKYRCRFAMDTTAFLFTENISFNLTGYNSALFDLYNDSLISGITLCNKYFAKQAIASTRRLKAKLGILKKYKDSLSLPIYQLLYIDVIASVQKGVYGATFINYGKNLIEENADLSNIQSLIQKSLLEEDNIPDEILAKSNNYVDYIWYKERVKYYLAHHRFDMDSMYSIFKTNYAGKFREKLLTYHLYKSFNNLTNSENAVNDALNTAVLKMEYRNLLNRARYVTKGVQAYNFALPDLANDTVKLSDFMGKVVFLDFYFKGCGACKTYYQNVVSNVKKKYKNNPNVVFVAISIDIFKENWLEAVKSGDYTSLQAINLYTGGKGTKHPVIENNFIIGYPTPMLIDKNGKLFSKDRGALGWGDNGNYEDNIKNLDHEIGKALAAK